MLYLVYIHIRFLAYRPTVTAGCSKFIISEIVEFNELQFRQAKNYKLEKCHFLILRI